MSASISRRLPTYAFRWFDLRAGLRKLHLHNLKIALVAFDFNGQRAIRGIQRCR